MSDVIEFGGVQIGDQGRLLVPRVEALGHDAEPMLWSTFADVDDTSRNWVYRIRVAAAVVRNADWKLMQYIGSLRASLSGVKADLVWKTGSAVRLTWPGARLDVIRPPLRKEQLRAGFDVTIILEFTSASDPTA